MAVIHCPMVMSSHNRVGTVVDTVVLRVCYDLKLDDRQATDHHDHDHLVIIVVVIPDTTKDDQINHPVVGKADQGLT
jgi:hypothetical protein